MIAAPMLISTGTVAVLDQAYLSFVQTNDEQQQYAMTHDSNVVAVTASPTPAGLTKSGLVLSTSPPEGINTLVVCKGAATRTSCVTNKASESV
jgi:hypothetical protein